MWTILSAITGIIPGIVSSIQGYIEHRQQLKLLERQAEIEAAKQEATGQQSADSAQIEDNKKSWKDEYVVLLVTLPVLGCFLPYTAPYIKIGFETLKNTVPEWYTMLYSIVILSVLGARTFFKYFKKK